MGELNKILVVDGERHIVRLVQVNLARAGYEVITALDGEQALAKAESEQPDIILLGTIPSPMDAAQVVERLRANEATKGVRVVLLSGKGEVGDLSPEGGAKH